MAISAVLLPLLLLPLLLLLLLLPLLLLRLLLLQAPAPPEERTLQLRPPV